MKKISQKRTLPSLRRKLNLTQQAAKIPENERPRGLMLVTHAILKVGSEEVCLVEVVQDLVGMLEMLMSRFHPLIISFMILFSTLKSQFTNWPLSG